MFVSSREYKVMLDHRLFADHQATSFGRELLACAQRLNIECRGEFAETKEREIVFLDTLDHTIRLNRFVFRRRANTEYTLKCRSPDRYVAAGADVKSPRGGKAKLEEDIGPPFVVRFSHSNTVKAKQAPRTLKQAARLFPALGELERDGERCPDRLELMPVSAPAYERVIAGPTLIFGQTKAEVAVILWSDGPTGRPLVAEFSFRYKDKREALGPRTARIAMTFFEEVQRLDWCSPGRTKTQYAYRE